MKINIASFTETEMIARLLTIQRAYNAKASELLQDKAQFDAWVKEQAQTSFIYPQDKEQHVCAHLSLFVLGNNNNSFSKAINLL